MRSDASLLSVTVEDLYTVDMDSDQDECGFFEKLYGYNPTKKVPKTTFNLL